VQNRFQQQETLYKIMKTEKWAVFLILTFILLVASFSIIGSLSMLIIDKKKDIGILNSMGAPEATIRRIFLLAGLLVSLSGATAGLILGWLVCFLQQTFGLIKLQTGDSFVVSAYPVQMNGLDFVSVFVTVFLIGLIAAWIPAYRIRKLQG
jgi:lipoprotein-releasing system permease protein